MEQGRAVPQAITARPARVGGTGDPSPCHSPHHSRRALWKAPASLGRERTAAATADPTRSGSSRRPRGEPFRSAGDRATARRRRPASAQSTRPHDHDPDRLDASMVSADRAADAIACGAVSIVNIKAVSVGGYLDSQSHPQSRTSERGCRLEWGHARHRSGQSRECRSVQPAGFSLRSGISRSLTGSTAGTSPSASRSRTGASRFRPAPGSVSRRGIRVCSQYTPGSARVRGEHPAIPWRGFCRGDHPRVRGEHTVRRLLMCPRSESSPRTRGALFANGCPARRAPCSIEPALPPPPSRLRYPQLDQQTRGQ